MDSSAVSGKALEVLEVVAEVLEVHWVYINPTRIYVSLGTVQTCLFEAAE
jgi:hypothetical protein